VVAREGGGTWDILQTPFLKYNWRVLLANTSIPFMHACSSIRVHMRMRVCVCVLTMHAHVPPCTHSRSPPRQIVG
jgi:hypothetical protein